MILFRKIKTFLKLIIAPIYIIPIIKKPLPKNPFGKKIIGTKEIYLKLHSQAILNLNGSTDYVQINGLSQVGGGTPGFLGGEKYCYFGAYRIGA